MHAKDSKIDTEERIIQAAQSVFARKGKDGARMQEIADEAGINKAMLHYYFRSKQKLYEAVFKYVFRQFARQHAAAIQESDTLAGTLKRFINGFIDSIKEKPDIVRLMVNENLSGGSTLGNLIVEKDHATAPPSLLKVKIEEAISKGEIKPVDPEHTLLTVLSCCLFFFIWAPTIHIRIPESQDWDAFVEKRKEHIFDVIYNGLLPK